MLDDFDAEVANRFKVLDDVRVPDTWSRVQFKVLDRMPVEFTDEGATMIDLATPVPTDDRQQRPKRVLVAGLLTAAVVVAIAVVATRDDDATPADQPSSTVTVSPTVPPTLSSGRWSPELTAQVLRPPIDCNRNPPRPEWSKCPGLAVSPDGTLVAYDPEAATLTWYEEEPRVVSLELHGALLEIGPHDVAYFHTISNWIVAVAPSGVEITRTHGSNAGAYPTATGLVQFHSGSMDSHQCLSASAAPPIPWVDPDGNPITDTRSFPTATATDAGIEIRHGEREWLLADEEAGRTPGRLECLDFRPRSDGGAVLVVDVWPRARGRLTVFELLPDGAIERYFIDEVPRVLPDGSMIVEHDHQLIHLTLPAGVEF